MPETQFSPLQGKAILFNSYKTFLNSFKLLKNCVCTFSGIWFQRFFFLIILN